MGFFYVPATPNIMDLFYVLSTMGLSYVQQIHNIMGLFYVARPICYNGSFLCTAPLTLYNSTDKLWEALAQLEMMEWKKVVAAIPINSESGGRFRYYRQLKSSPLAEEYIMSSAAIGKKRIITQLRCGCLPLEIETGRHRSPKQPLSERRCQLCQSDVGDELHFLLKCPSLSTTREPMLEAISAIYPSFQTLPDEQHPSNLCNITRNK